MGDALGPLSGKYFGKYRGLVVDSGDPLNRGRLRVRTPAVPGDQEVWAMPCVPYAGDGVGFVFRPQAIPSKSAGPSSFSCSMPLTRPALSFPWTAAHPNCDPVTALLRRHLLRARRRQLRENIKIREAVAM